MRVTVQTKLLNLHLNKKTSGQKNGNVVWVRSSGLLMKWLHYYESQTDELQKDKWEISPILSQTSQLFTLYNIISFPQFKCCLIHLNPSLWLTPPWVRHTCPLHFESKRWLVCTHGHREVGSPSLSNLGLPIDVDGLHRFQQFFLDQQIVQETADLTWSHQDFELMPLSVIKSLRWGTDIS